MPALDPTEVKRCIEETDKLLPPARPGHEVERKTAMERLCTLGLSGNPPCQNNVEGEITCAKGPRSENK